MKYMTELEILRKTSERQSEMLALALKEKNDLLGKVTYIDKSYYTDQIKYLRAEYLRVEDELRNMKDMARQLFTKLGLS
jgi:hypothetical protein